MTVKQLKEEQEAQMESLKSLSCVRLPFYNLANTNKKHAVAYRWCINERGEEVGGAEWENKRADRKETQERSNQ